jgi:hypothetical protein
MAATPCTVVSYAKKRDALEELLRLFRRYRAPINVTEPIFTLDNLAAGLGKISGVVMRTIFAVHFPTPLSSAIISSYCIDGGPDSISDPQYVYLPYCQCRKCGKIHSAYESVFPCFSFSVRGSLEFFLCFKSQSHG